MAKTIALTCILKDEVHNLERFCKSFGGLFDEYHFTDTGSTDGSQDWILNESYKFLAVDRSNIHLHHFSWVDDFAKARNFALPIIGADYWMWADLDDVLHNVENFKAFCRESIGMHDHWYLPYNYALKEDGTPAVSFVRERVFRTSKGYRFKDPIHEGVDTREVENANGLVINSFAINHLRTHEEMLKDKNDGRNLRILEKNKDILSERLKFYYGKELYDVQRFEEAYESLNAVCKSHTLELGDRLMAMQFCAQSLNMLNRPVDSLRFSVLGINLDPERAEYYCIMAESYMKMNEPHKAIPLFTAARSCPDRAKSGTRHEFSYSDCYDILPRINLARIYFSQGRFEEVISELDPIMFKADEQTKGLYQEAQKAIKATTIPADARECDDIVFTCPFPTPYPWDEKGYKTTGYGGSETACIEMAKWLKVKTGRIVKVFQPRTGTLVSESGVEYIPAEQLHTYFQKWKPALHIAWRHCARFTNAPSYVWSHDLFTPHAEHTQNYDKILALSGAHRDMLVGMQGISAEKIIVTRNGIEPKRFLGDVKVTKKPGKVMWPNSPDRGIQYAMLAMDEVIKEIPHAELHCFYGFDNMKKAGGYMAEKALMLEKMVAERPYVKYHGNVNQDVLAKHFIESEVWLYTADFFETFCISGLESLAAQCWPIVRRFGALKDTLRIAEERGWGDVIDCDMSDETVPLFVDKVISALKEEKWKKIDFDPSLVSWAALADEWIDMLNLK